MDPNPPVGVILHAIGGLASAVFYLPFRKVKNWAWESYWMIGGIFSWIVAPWVIAALATPNLMATLREAPMKSVLWSYFFGALWGVGGLTFGLTVRYLGFALGTAMALGYCAAFGTLLPPIVDGQFGNVVSQTSGLIVLAGVVVCFIGIAINGLAGICKEREMPEAEKKASVREFDFRKGVLVATFCGIMSACMSYGFAAGKPIAAIAVRNGASELWKNLPVLIIILAGGFTTNFVWCLALNLRNKTLGNYINARTSGALLITNYVFSAMAGTIWYLQFFFYGMGTSKMGRFDFSSWTLHMASIIIFGTLVGVCLSEWKGASQRTHRLMISGLAVLVSSTLVIGYGNYLAKAPTTSATIEPSSESVVLDRVSK
jgi:L-rhamnose-H+ transport protein